MKILNIILSIFIFLLAAASAVFSYFLFEKRAQFVSSHEKMAKTIYESSKTLDSGSGTDEAKKLTPEILAHDKYAALDSALPTLPGQSKKIIAQRNALAQSLWNIGDAIRMRDIGEVESYRRMETYTGRMDAVVAGVADTVKHRDNAYTAISDVAKTYRVNIQPQSLVNAADIRASRQVLKPLADFIKNTLANSNAYRLALVEVSRLAGKKVNVTDARRDAGIKDVKAVVAKKVGEVNTLRGELSKVKRENIKLSGTVRNRDAQIRAAEKKYKDVSNALSELKESIGVARNYRPWRAGSEEARSRMFGKVTAVSKEYGYFVIDLGERSVVYQESNGKKVPIALKLTSGIEVAVVRKPASPVQQAVKKDAEEAQTDPEALRGKVWYTDSGKVISEGAGAKNAANASAASVNREQAAAEVKEKNVVFIASSRIVRVGEVESVVDLPAGSDVKVGDIVLYKNQVK